MTSDKAERREAKRKEKLSKLHKRLGAPSDFDRATLPDVGQIVDLEDIGLARYVSTGGGNGTFLTWESHGTIREITVSTDQIVKLSQGYSLGDSTSRYLSRSTGSAYFVMRGQMLKLPEPSSSQPQQEEEATA